MILGLLVGIGMTQWPYSHGCGLRLIFYLVGVIAVIATGVWSSVSSWRGRLGLAPHTVLIEQNGAALHQREWTERRVRDDDRIEFVRVVAGG